MNRFWIAITTFCLLGTVTGCGAGGGIGIASSDGGPVGTGISASVSGNVVSITQGSAAAVPTVRVSIDEVAGIESTTDADGNFELEGDFSGILTLRFSTSMYAVTEQVDVPAGSTIVLEDLQLTAKMVQMGAVRQLGFLGVVAHTDCGSGVILVNDRRLKANQFMVRLGPTTTILDGKGQVLPCASIQTGQQVVVRGAIQLTDQTIVALGVVVGPAASDQVQLAGRVMSKNCNSGVVTLSEPTGKSGMPGMSGMPGTVGMVGRSRVQLSGSTHITDANGQPLRCQDIQIGDRIEVDGAVDNNKPGIIDAQTMMRSAS